MFRGYNARNIAGAVIGTLLLVWPAGAAGAQTSWDRYRPGTLTAVMGQIETEIRDAVATVPNREKRPSEHFPGDDNATVATAIYKGESRPIDPIRSGLIARWGLARMRDSSIATDFHREY